MKINRFLLIAMRCFFFAVLSICLAADAELNMKGEGLYIQSPLAFQEVSIGIGGLWETKYLSGSVSGGYSDFVNGAYESAATIRGSLRFGDRRSFLRLGGFIYPNRGLGNDHRLELSSSSLIDAPVFISGFASYRSTRFNTHDWLASDLKISAGPGFKISDSYLSLGVSYYLAGARQETQGDKIVDRVFKSDGLGIYLGIDFDPSWLSPSFYKSYLRLVFSYDLVESEDIYREKTSENLFSMSVSIGESNQTLAYRRTLAYIARYVKGKSE